MSTSASSSTHDERLLQLGNAHVKSTARLGYGTAGFRTEARLLDAVMVRVGVVAGLRSMALGGATVGAMVTASHNPVQDNGVKVVEPMGEMMVARWEAHAETIANAVDGVALVAAVHAITAAESIALDVAGSVVVGADTRPSSGPLVALLKEGLSALSVRIRDVGVVTTPQLHYIVRGMNSGAGDAASVEGYFAQLASAWAELMRAAAGSAAAEPMRLVVDGACGVGAPAFEALLDALRTAGAPIAASLEASGREPGDVLNHECGADFVKTTQSAPVRLRDRLQRGTVYASLDGDADRIVFFHSAGGAFELLDGDRIAALAAFYFRELFASLDLAEPVRWGIVQTAYANGASTRFLRSQGVPVVFAQTGVKHLHHEAVAFDAAIYFEANGHGTVLFSSALLARLEASLNIRPHGPAADAVRITLAFSRLINQAVGDALSDLLLVLAVLALKGMDVAAWSQLYADLPNRLAKTKVADRAAFVATDADRVLAQPVGLQARIDAAVAAVDPMGRCFVRPSGTEDVVRIYAEATTHAAADAIVAAVTAAVAEFAT